MGSNVSVTSPVPINKSNKVPSIESLKATGFKCLSCGKIYARPNAGFYHKADSELFKSNQGYSFICKSCVQKILRTLQRKRASMITQVQTMCFLLDLPYVANIARKMTSNTPAALIEEYQQRLTTVASTVSKDYIASLTAGESVESATRVGEDMWDENSKYNKEYILDIVGYDPFEDPSLNADARKYLFNTMAGYCPDSSVGTDSHKLQSIINIVLAQQQVHVIDELLQKELAKEAKDVDQAVVLKYTSIKKDLLSSIDKLADNNEISAKTTKTARGANTLSGKMQRIQQDLFKGIAVNQFDIKTAQAFQQIADISAHALVKELQLQDNDYSDIVTEQRDTITRQNKLVDELTEQNRILNNELVTAKQERDEYHKILEDEGLC